MRFVGGAGGGACVGPERLNDVSKEEERGGGGTVGVGADKNEPEWRGLTGLGSIQNFI
jgi:hypothetical protein